ncbi:hypothetical protein E2C01_029707 [Portunus trituberculatus]|uniref:Uncharacterized protein n=1 Tax=Portunus trituberculatus TaxID=210409 RepID=A0A5B7ES74_PORTR|nr:hypothetical protein [Portunus trituberculatus]
MQIGAAMVQWNHACFGVRVVSKHTGSNPVHGPSQFSSEHTNYYPSYFPSSDNSKDCSEQRFR